MKGEVDRGERFSVAAGHLTNVILSEFFGGRGRSATVKLVWQKLRFAKGLLSQ